MKMYNVLKSCIFKTALLFFISFVAYSCEDTNQENNLVYRSISLHPTDSFELLVPTPYFQTHKWNIVDNNKHLLLSEYGNDNHGNIVIYFIDLQNRTYSNQVIIEQEGPDGYNSSAAEVLVHNIDSIFVFPVVANQFYLYGSKGDKINTYKYNSPNGYGFFGSSNLITAPLINGDNLVLNTNKPLRYNDKQFLKENIPFHLYGLTNHELTPLLHYPEKFHGKYLPPQFWGGQTININDSVLAINFHFTPEILLYNLNTGSSTNIFMGFQDPIEPLTSFPGDMEGLEYKIKEDFYAWATLHDNKLYRLANHVEESNKSLKVYEILSGNLRNTVLFEYDLDNGKTKRFENLPLARHFVVKNDKLYVGSVSIKEDSALNTYKKYYIYDLNESY